MVAEGRGRVAARCDTGPAMPRLYYMPRTRSSRVLWLLAEIGAPYELTKLAPEERSSVDHLARHPLGRVPALELDDGTVMFESAAICLQLADLHPDAGLIPPLGSAAVSYTHLDVYKRQRITCSPPGSWRARWTSQASSR